MLKPAKQNFEISQGHTEDYQLKRERMDIATLVNNAARKGQTSIEVKFENPAVIDELIVNGYSVSVSGKRLTISWFKQVESKSRVYS